MAKKTTNSDIDDYLHPLTIEEDRVHGLARQFANTYKHLALHSTDQFLPTPITALPTGQEKGKFLSIDVGGTNLRVGFIELLGDDADTFRVSVSSDHEAASQNATVTAHHARIRRTSEKAWPIGEHLKMDNAEDLFNWIGDCIAEVVRDNVTSSLLGKESVPQELPMGITFSFPMMQSSLSEATLMPMGKGFAMASNLNLGSMLLAGYERHSRGILNGHLGPDTRQGKLARLPRLRIAAIANDTVATLASLAYTVKSIPNSRVAMGLIVGTGCNATIPMKLRDLHPAKRPSATSYKKQDPEIVINTEWTINGAAKPLNDQRLLTVWDKLLDRECDAPGFQPFEYMTAGRYLGELVRIIVFLWFTEIVGYDFEDLPEGLRIRNQLSTTFLAIVVAPVEDPILLAATLDEKLPRSKNSAWRWDVESARMVMQAAKAVQLRSSALIAAATVGLLACAGELSLPDDSRRSKEPQTNGHTNSQSGTVEELVVAYTGSLISLYPGFKEETQRQIDRILQRESYLNRDKKVVLREASDGGIIGAGVLADIHHLIFVKSVVALTFAFAFRPPNHHFGQAVTVEVMVAHVPGGQTVWQGKRVVAVFAVTGQLHGTVTVVVPRIRHCGSKQTLVKGLHVVGLLDTVTVGHEPYFCASAGVELARRLVDHSY